MEVSSKIRPKKFREVVQVPKKVSVCLLTVIDLVPATILTFNLEKKYYLNFYNPFMPLKDKTKHNKGIYYYKTAI